MLLKTKKDLREPEMGPTFAETRPPNVLVEVAKLVDEEALVEIEADAWVDE